MNDRVKSPAAASYATIAQQQRNKGFSPSFAKMIWPDYPSQGILGPAGAEAILRIVMRRNPPPAHLLKAAEEMAMILQPPSPTEPAHPRYEEYRQAVEAEITRMREEGIIVDSGHQR